MDAIEDTLSQMDFPLEDNQPSVDNGINSTSFNNSNETISSEPKLAPSLMRIPNNKQPEFSSNTPKLVISSPPKAIHMKAPSPSVKSTSSNQPLSSHPIKSLPANPLITKHDVESIHTVNSSTSSLSNQVSESPPQQLPQQQPQPQSPSTPVQQNGFFNSMITSLSFNTKSNPIEPEIENSQISDENSAGTISKNGDSPNIISYRRNRKAGSRRGTSTSSLDAGNLSPLNEDAKPYSPQTSKVLEDLPPSADYLDLKFKSTNYRYASDARNDDFHKLFKSIPSSERLIEDFSCALSREILLQGRLYISEHNICFNSNLLGWVTNLVVPFYDISNFEKTATVGLFQNGIAINLKNNNGKHSFATFLSRDSTYNMFQDVWTAANDESPDTHQQKNDISIVTNGAVLSKDFDLLNEPAREEYDHALMEIDGDTPKQRKYSNSLEDDDDEDDEYGDEDEDEYSYSDGTSSDNKSSDNKSEIQLRSQIIYKLKDSSKYKYEGPFVHPPTKSGYDPEANKETILATEKYNCPPGMLYEIIFGEDNELIKNQLKALDGKDFSEFTKYELNDEGLKTRKYTYEKGLNYGVGPKSTTCHVEETIEKSDFKNYINVVNTTQTPNVPSGGAFRVKTRYIFTWTEQNSTSLVVSFWVDWIGTSWMKGVIERSCKSGQEEATKALLKLIKEAISENIIEATEEVKVSDKPVETIVEETIVEKVITETKIEAPQPTETTYFNGQLTLFQSIVVVLLFIVALLQVFIVFSVIQLSSKAPNFNLLPSLNPKAEDLLFKGEEILIWNWIDERAGKLDGTEQFKTNALKKEIDIIINKWTLDELNSPEGERLVKQFEDNLNHYTTTFQGNERQKKERAEALRRSIQALL